jgi:hypothetical protein
MPARQPGQPSCAVGRQPAAQCPLRHVVLADDAHQRAAVLKVTAKHLPAGKRLFSLHRGQAGQPGTRIDSAICGERHTSSIPDPGSATPSRNRLVRNALPAAYAVASGSLPPVARSAAWIWVRRFSPPPLAGLLLPGRSRPRHPSAPPRPWHRADQFRGVHRSRAPPPGPRQHRNHPAVLLEDEVADAEIRAARRRRDRAAR